MASVSDTIRSAKGTARNTSERSLPVARPRYQKGSLRKRGMNYELRYREDLIDSEGSPFRVQRSIVLGQFEGKKEARRASEAYLRPFNRGGRRPQFDLSIGDFWDRHF